MLKRLIPLLALLALAGGLRAADPEAELRPLIHDWDVTHFQLDEERREAAFAELAERAAALREQYPGRAEPRIWEAIVLSSYAGAKGGLDALDLAERARDLLLEAERIDPQALDGSVYTSLGSLYYQVPGWPVGFGDDDKARGYLERALAANPAGIDPNYFYGDFLIEEGDYEEAVAALEKALQAPPRPGREVADQGRRAEVEARLEAAREKMNNDSGW